MSFAKSRRFYREELGPSHKGPFISNVRTPPPCLQDVLVGHGECLGRWPRPCRHRRRPGDDATASLGPSVLPCWTIGAPLRRLTGREMRRSFVWQLHSETTGPGSDSPGPAKYAHEGPPGRGQLGDGAKIGVGTAKRFTDKEGTSWVPGPGAYATHNTRIENTGHNHGMGKMFRRDPAFSMASCIRTDFTNLGGVRDNPAPIYEVCAVEERRRNRVNATKFGKATRATNDKSAYSLPPHPAVTLRQVLLATVQLPPVGYSQCARALWVRGAEKRHPHAIWTLGIPSMWGSLAHASGLGVGLALNQT